MPKYEFIKTSKSADSHIWTVSLANPKKMNALSFESLAEIEQFILNEVNPWSSGARVLVLKAEGKHFTAGLDLNSAMQVSNVGADVDEDKEAKPDAARTALKITELVTSL